jgi:DNA (cytosine-5)-methyltransferase 1
MEIPIISLFCGCGGFDLGFERPGFKVGLALDVDPIAVATYNFNHDKHAAVVADLSETTGQDIIKMWEDRQLPAPRGVIGGSPCQTFSCGNVHFKLDDARHTLPRQYASILKTLNDHYTLDFFIFENVRGITYEKHRQTFAEFKVLFEAADFRLFDQMLDAVDFGVAQNRPRVFVVGVNRNKYPNASFTFPSPLVNRPVPVKRKIEGLPQPLFSDRKQKLTPEDVRAGAGHPNHWAMQPRSEKFHNGFLKEGDCQGRSFRVLSWNKPSWTVAYGHREVHIHPSGTRRLSIYEAMLLQGFPKRYQLLGTISQQIRQVSDAIPPPVGKALGTALHQFLATEALRQKTRLRRQERGC